MMLREVINVLKVYYANANETEKQIMGCVSAALSNIVANLMGVFAVELITYMISEIGVAASLACVYLAGLIFINMLLALVRRGRHVDNLENVSETVCKSISVNQTAADKDIKDAFN